MKIQHSKTISSFGGINFVFEYLKDLSEENRTCRTKRGTVDHIYNTNSRLAEFNIRLLKKLGVFANESLTLD